MGGKRQHLNGYKAFIMDEFGSLAEFRRLMSENASEIFRKGRELSFTRPWIRRHVDDPLNATLPVLRLVSRVSKRSLNELDKIIGEGEE